MLWTKLFCNWEHTLTKQEHINMCIKYLKGAKRMGLESWWCLAKDLEEQEETEHWKFPLNMQKVIFIFRMTQHWRYSKPTWIQSCTVCLRWTCCTTGFGLECLYRFNSKHCYFVWSDNGTEEFARSRNFWKDTYSFDEGQ